MLTAAGVQALDNVASSLKTCYGPNGLHALGEGGDGRITFLHNGDQIFALHLNHPLMRFIGQALQCHRHSTGDGSKKIIFMLTSLLKESHQELLASCNSRNSIELSRVLHRLQSDLVNSVIPGLIDNPSTRKVWCAVRRSDSKTALKVHLGKILTTSFGSCFSYSVRKRLKELLMELLFPPTSEASLSSHSPIDDLTQLISHYQRCLDTHVVCVEGVSVSQSKVYPGFLLEREFVEPALLPSLGKSSRFKALLLHSDLSLDAGDATISIASRSYLEGTMGHLSKHSVRAVEWMTLNNVRLLLCAAKLSPAAVNLLTQHNITAVQFVDKDLLLSIAEYCETIPYSHTQHLFQCQETSDTGKHFTVDCTTCRYIHVGRRRLIHLEFLRSSEWEGEHSEVSATGCVRSGCPGCLHSIALCAPTASYCRQLAKVVLNSLQVAGRWTQPVLVGGEACLVSVCGGGAWEMALARQLEEHINTNKIQKETALWTVIKALKKGLLQVPLTLVVNASAETERKKNTTHLLCDVGHTHPAMVSPIDGSLIEVGEPELWVAAQPLTMEQDIVLCALSLVGQLLRIDGVIAVKKGILLNKAGQDQQNSDSENEE